MWTLIRNLLLVLLAPIALTLGVAKAQVSSRSGLQAMVDSVTGSTRARTPGKLYIHTDRPAYFLNDTLRFKAYLFYADALGNRMQDELLYIEIADGQNKLVKRQLVQLYAGLGWGGIGLQEKFFSPGTYTIRAYTSWMRNFDRRYFFERRFSITGEASDNWLIRASLATKELAGVRTAETQLALQRANGSAVAGKNLDVRVADGGKTLNRGVVRSDASGLLSFNFPLPEQPGNLSVEIKTPKEDAEKQELVFPLPFAEARNIDLQFMPEGGDLVAGLRSRVAFKAMDADGRSVDVAGSIYDRSGQKVADFKADYQGMGIVSLQPRAGEVYSAKLTSPGRAATVYPLPEVKASGVLLRVDNYLGGDSLQVGISANGAWPGQRLYLLGQARGVGCYAAMVPVTDSMRFFTIPRSAFPSGIARLSLFSPSKTLLSERSVFIRRDDLLYADVRANQASYSTRDSVALELLVKDADDRPVTGSFSIAVTDDSQVNADTVRNGTLVSQLLLTSELGGEVETPGYYFPWKMDATVWHRLDVLLLAQGWRGPKPVRPRKGLTPDWPRESTYAVEGKVTNLLNRPADAGKVVLFGRKPTVVLDTLIGADGRFRFGKLYPSDSTTYFIQARNKRGKSFGVGLELAPFEPPVFSPMKPSLPWYVNLDSGDLGALKHRIAYKLEQDRLLGIRELKEVKLLGKKVIKNSKNLNGQGESDFAMGEEELARAGKMDLEKLLFANVKGFVARANKQGKLFYSLRNQLAHLVIDGVNVEFFKGEEESLYEFTRTYLLMLTAEDIKGIEIMYNLGTVGRYQAEYLNPMDNPSDHAFIEVTTYSGNGAFLKRTPGTELFRPLAFAPEARFYSPKYLVKTTSPFRDTRPTIFWNPNIVTDRNGKAHISFYTSDRAGTYSVILEGADMNGLIGTSVSRIVVK